VYVGVDAQRDAAQRDDGFGHDQLPQPARSVCTKITRASISY
jgi:hypothetical protein